MPRLAYLAKWLRYRVAFPLLSVLPRSLGYRIVARIGNWDENHDVNRNAIASGLIRVFPYLTQQPDYLKILLQHHYRMMARDTLDCFLMPRFTPSNAANMIRVEHAEVLSEAQAVGKGVIMVISHYGRFFMLGPGIKFAGMEFGMLTTVVDERHPSYDPVDRWYIATKLHNTQLFSRETWVTTADDPRALYRSLKAGKIMLVAMDGTETSSPNRTNLPFLGGTLSIPQGILRVATKTGARLVFASVKEEGYGVKISLHALPDEPMSALVEAARLLECDVIAYPWQWWQWAATGALWHPDPGTDTSQIRPQA